MDNDFKQEMDKVLLRLKGFPPDVLDWREPASPMLVERFEYVFQVELPEDYKYLLGVSNGFSLMGDEILGIRGDGAYDLADVYRFEHFEVIVPQYRHLVPFSPDGGGNFYCFDTRVKTGGGHSNPIVFWRSNHEYDELNPPETVCTSLSDFIKGWMPAPGLESHGLDDGGEADRQMPDDFQIEIDASDKIDRSLLDPPAMPGSPPTFKKNGVPVEIHYEGQYPNGKFKEMSREEHRGKGFSKRD